LDCVLFPRLESLPAIDSTDPLILVVSDEAAAGVSDGPIREI
jgi:hypothetical protein